jgi:hypothetical protein
MEHVAQVDIVVENNLQNRAHFPSKRECALQSNFLSSIFLVLKNELKLLAVSTAK